MNLILSIITINYNNATGLQKTIESVMSQTSHDFEYLVVDGGSTDGSIDVIHQFNSKNSRQFKWISEPDQGIYHAMNKGIKLSVGEYVQFLNSGDRLVDESVTERMLENMTGAGFIYGNKIKVFSNGRRIIEKEINLNSLLTLYYGSLNHATTYIKKELFNKYGFYDENYKIVSDWKFFLVAIGLNNESVQYRNIDMIYFDMTGISNSNHILDKKERRQVLEELLPAKILADYDDHYFAIDQMRRINRYSVSKRVVWFLERVLFKMEKWKILKV